jgi:hypothetical protein
MPPPLISHVPVAGLNKNRARSQSHPQRRPRVYTHIQCIRLCREIKNYYRQCKSTVSRKGISSLLALSQLQYKQTLFHNSKHNYCFKCVRISRHHKSIFEIPKNASGRNSDFYTIILNTVRQSSSGVRDYAGKGNTDHHGSADPRLKTNINRADNCIVANSFTSQWVWGLCLYHNPFVLTSASRSLVHYHSESVVLSSYSFFQTAAKKCAVIWRYSA